MTYNYWGTGTLTDFFYIFHAIFNEMSDFHPLIVNSLIVPVSIKYKYKLANQEVLSFDEPIICLQIFWQSWKIKWALWYEIHETSFANKTFKFYFRRISRFHWRRNLSNKVAIVEEELDGIDKDGIGNSMDLPRLMFINEECGNLKVVVDGG